MKIYVDGVEQGGTPPLATTSSPGIVQVGSGLNVSAAGVLSVSGGGGGGGVQTVVHSSWSSQIEPNKTNIYWGLGSITPATSVTWTSVPASFDTTVVMRAASFLGGSSAAAVTKVFAPVKDVSYQITESWPDSVAAGRTYIFRFAGTPSNFMCHVEFTAS